MLYVCWRHRNDLIFDTKAWSANSVVMKLNKILQDMNVARNHLQKDHRYHTQRRMEKLIFWNPLVLDQVALNSGLQGVCSGVLRHADGYELGLLQN